MRIRQWRATDFQKWSDQVHPYDIGNVFGGKKCRELIRAGKERNGQDFQGAYLVQEQVLHPKVPGTKLIAEVVGRK